MDQITADTMINLLRMGLDFVMVPIVIVMWRLMTSVQRLEILLYREFATKQEVRDYMKGLKNDRPE